MPVTPLHNADILNETTGQASDASSATVDLTGATTGTGDPGSGTTTSGTKLLILVFSGKALNTPSGFTQDFSSVANSNQYVYLFRKDTTGAESSWTVNVTSGTTALQWYVAEVQRLAAGAPLDASANQTGLEDPESTSSALVTRNDCFAFGGFGMRSSTSQSTLNNLTITKDATSDPWAKSFTVRWATESTVNFGSTFIRSFTYPDAAIIYVGDLTGQSGILAAGLNPIIVYASTDAGRPDCLDLADGFEYGVTPNTASPLSTRRLLDVANGTWGTQYAISSASPRSGTYHLRITQSAAAGRVGWSAGGQFPISQDEGVLGAGFKINSSTGTVVLAELAPASGTILQLVYDTSATQLGLRWGSGGTIAYQSATTATGTWVWVDISADGFTGTGRVARWSVDGLEEDGPADLTGQSTSSLGTVSLGLNASQTVTFDVDDVCLSTHGADYPLGAHNVRLLTVDPSGTAFTGSDSLFNVFTANGTLAAWNATNARNAVDEAPPTISTSADGVVQVTTGSFWATFPMSTYTLAAGEVIDYVGAVFPLWSNGTQNATLNLRGDNQADPATDFLTTATAYSPGNAAQPASSTVPSWVRGKWADTKNWSQVRLDAANLEMGGSGDATPDTGIHAAYLQVAVRERSTTRIYGPDADGLTVDVTRGAGNYSVQTYEVNTGPTYGATLRYVKAGVEVAQHVDPNDTLSETVTAGYLDEVSRVTIEPDPPA